MRCLLRGLRWCGARMGTIIPGPYSADLLRSEAVFYSQSTRGDQRSGTTVSPGSLPFPCSWLPPSLLWRADVVGAVVSAAPAR